MISYDTWWKFIERPRRKIQSFFRYKLLKRSNAFLIQKKADKLRGQLMLDDFRLVRLLGWTDQHEEDYYWVVDTRKGIVLSSCCGGFKKLKGKISRWDYLHTDDIWKLNGHSVEDGLERAKKEKIKIK